MLLLTCFSLQVSSIFGQTKPRVELLTHGRHAGQVAITKLPTPFLWEVSQKNPLTVEWKQMIRVALKSNLNTSPLNMLGKYVISEDSILFNPRFPFLEGEIYTVQLNMAYINIFMGNTPNDVKRDHINYDIKIPSSDHTALEVKNIYPTSDSLPENLLRFYFYFTNPMKGGVLKHIYLYDENGTKLTDTFLDIGHELWSSNDQRLTIWLDPGRIKRDLQPHQKKGIPLTKGQKYKLIIDNKVEDVFGQKPKARLEKLFTVIEADRSKPDIQNWIINSPKPFTEKPVIIYFGESMDHSLITNYLKVIRNGAVINGEFIALKEETEVAFYPETEWKEGEYQLEVSGLVEDLAGNSLQRLFDSDLSGNDLPKKEKEHYFKIFYVH